MANFVTLLQVMDNEHDVDGILQVRIVASWSSQIYVVTDDTECVFMHSGGWDQNFYVGSMYSLFQPSYEHNILRFGYAEEIQDSNSYVLRVYG